MNTLIVITDFDFDYLSGAGYSRIMCYALALAKKNVQVKIFSSKYCYSSSFKEERLNENTVLLKGGEKIHYKTTFEEFHFLRIYRYIKSVYHLSQIKSKYKNLSYFVYQTKLPYTLLSILYLKIIKKCKVFIEKNELQTAIAKNKLIDNTSLFNRALLMLYKPINVSLGFIADILAIWFNGIIVISTNFEKKYKRFQKNIIRIPILVNNTVSHRIISRHKENIFKIGYFGWIGESKDGLFSLIKAVININSNINHNIILHIFGSGPRINIFKIKELCVQHKFIIYGGHLESKSVANKLIEYNLLAFPRPINLQTKYGFSTKLAEFLISGVPLLTTSVSDNSLFIRDGENGFLLEARKKIDINSLVEKLEEILALDRNTLLRIGEKGKETALQNFNPLTYSDKIYSFLA